jgi:hypothetical protein
MEKRAYPFWCAYFKHSKCPLAAARTPVSSHPHPCVCAYLFLVSYSPRTLVCSVYALKPRTRACARIYLLLLHTHAHAPRTLLPMSCQQFIVLSYYFYLRASFLCATGFSLFLFLFFFIIFL